MFVNSEKKRQNNDAILTCTEKKEHKKIYTHISVRTGYFSLDLSRLENILRDYVTHC